jgi:hypothetical protein
MTAKKIVELKATMLGASWQRCYTKKVSFSDLARGDGQFIYFEHLVWNSYNRWDELKTTAKDNGLILGS